MAYNNLRMRGISNQIGENITIDELYRYMIKCGELQCHRMNAPGGMAGELIIKVLNNEKAFSIVEVFVSRKFRNVGLGSSLLLFAEKTACTLGFRSVELKGRCKIKAGYWKSVCYVFIFED